VYNEEPHTYIDKKLTYVDETKTETYPSIRYEEQKMTKEISFTVNVPEAKTENYTATRYDRVEDQRVETYTVQIPITVVKEQLVKVCVMVPSVVSTTFDPCMSGGSSGGSGDGAGCGCGCASGGCACGG